MLPRRDSGSYGQIQIPERDEQARRRGRRRCQRDLGRRERDERSFAPHEKVDQVERLCIRRDGVTRRILEYPIVRRGTSSPIDQPRMDILGEAMNGLDVFWWRRAAADGRLAAVIEDAVERQHPRPHRAVPKRVRTCRVGRRHPANRAELTTRRVNTKSQADTGRPPLKFAPEDDDFSPYGSPLDVWLVELAQTAEIQHYAGADGASRHAAAGPPRYNLTPAIVRPLHDLRDVVSVGGNS